MRTAGEKKLDKDIGSRHTIWQGLWIRLTADTSEVTRVDWNSSSNGVVERQVDRDKKTIWDDGVGRGWWRHHICGTMRTAVAETQEDKIRHIGWENIYGVPNQQNGNSSFDGCIFVPHRGVSNKQVSHAAYRCRITTTEMVSWISYKKRGCSGGSWQWQ